MESRRDEGVEINESEMVEFLSNSFDGDETEDAPVVQLPTARQVESTSGNRLVELQPPAPKDPDDSDCFAFSCTQSGKPNIFRLVEVLPKAILAAHNRDTVKDIICSSLSTHFQYWQYEENLDGLHLNLPSYRNLLEGDRELVQYIMSEVWTNLRPYVKSAKEVTLPSINVDITLSDLETFLPDNIEIKSLFNVALTDAKISADDCSRKLFPLLKSLQDKHCAEESSRPKYAISTLDPTMRLPRNFQKMINNAFAREVSYSWNNKEPKSSTASSAITEINYTSDSKQDELFKGSTSMNPYHYWNLKYIHTKYTGKGTIIAVVDSGIELCHSAFKTNGLPQIMGVIDFSEDNVGRTGDVNGHGTKCAGIACGQAFKADGCGMDIPSGVAPGARLIVCKVANNDNKITDIAITRALQWLNKYFTDRPPGQNVDVVSLSFGKRQFSKPVEKAVTDLIQSNVIVVCAASNHGHKYRQAICFPARLGHVLCIGSHDCHGKSSRFSPVGQQIDFLAPGESIMAPASGTYSHAAIFHGTSGATPAIAGLACLILECINKTCPDAVVKEIHNHWIIKEIIREMGTNSGMHCDDRGYGALNPERFFEEPKGFIKTIFRELNPEVARKL